MGFGEMTELLQQTVMEASEGFSSTGGRTHFPRARGPSSRELARGRRCCLIHFIPSYAKDDLGVTVACVLKVQVKLRRWA